MTEHRYRHLLRGGASAGSGQGRPDNATCFLLGTSSLGLAFYCLFVPVGETLIALQEFAHAQALDDMY
jgi:hypothetical protein